MMPEISRFLGIVIYMYFKEHNPPHFHVEYNEFSASILIDTLGILDGKLPPRVMSLVVEWAALHQVDLMSDWEELKKSGTYHRIDPLV